MVDRGLSLRIPWFFFAGVLPACAGFFPGAFAGGPNEGITGGRAGPRAANPNEDWPPGAGAAPRFRTERPGGPRSRGDRSGGPKIRPCISARPGAGPISQWSSSPFFFRRLRSSSPFFLLSFPRAVVRGGSKYGGPASTPGPFIGGDVCALVSVLGWMIIEVAKGCARMDGGAVIIASTSASIAARSWVIDVDVILAPRPACSVGDPRPPRCGAPGGIVVGSTTWPAGATWAGMCPVRRGGTPYTALDRLLSGGGEVCREAPPLPGSARG